MIDAKNKRPETKHGHFRLQGLGTEHGMQRQTLDKQGWMLGGYEMLHMSQRRPLQVRRVKNRTCLSKKVYPAGLLLLLALQVSIENPFFASDVGVCHDGRPSTLTTLSQIASDSKRFDRCSNRSG